MAYMLLCLDKPGCTALRDRTRLTHLEYLEPWLDRLSFAGPLTDDAGQIGIGSLYVLEVETREEVEAFLREEPYSQAGLFETVIIRRWRKAIPFADPDGLRKELERARAAVRG